MLATKNGASATTRIVSNSMPRTKPRERREPKRRSSTSRSDAKSWVENRIRMTVPRIPDSVRVAMIRSNARVISRRYTGILWLSCSTAAAIAVSWVSTNPVTETTRNRSGMMQIRK